MNYKMEKDYEYEISEEDQKEFKEEYNIELNDIIIFVYHYESAEKGYYDHTGAQITPDYGETYMLEYVISGNSIIDNPILDSFFDNYIVEELQDN